MTLISGKLYQFNLPCVYAHRIMRKNYNFIQMPNMSHICGQFRLDNNILMFILKCDLYYNLIDQSSNSLICLYDNILIATDSSLEKYLTELS